MQQATRIAIIGLLALMQLFAPLVHAHVGGAQPSGLVHIPGLEFLSKADQISAKTYTGKGQHGELIVSLSPGLKNQGLHTTTGSELEGGLPPQGLPKAKAVSRLGLTVKLPVTIVPLRSPAQLHPAVRAPPALG